MFLREEITEKFSNNDEPGLETLNEFAIRKGRILDNYIAEDYNGVIKECIELESTLGTDSLTPEIGLLFAISLSKKGFLKEAIKIGEGIIRELEGNPDILDLRASIIEWQLELGDQEQAFEVYEKLIDSLDEIETIYRRVELKVSDSLENTATPTEKIQGNLMENFDELYAIDRGLKDIEAARKKPINQEEVLDSSITLIEREEYEKAIRILEEFKAKQETPTEEVQRLENLAIEKLVHQERNRAAKLFLAGKENNDPKKKEGII